MEFTLQPIDFPKIFVEDGADRRLRITVFSLQRGICVAEEVSLQPLKNRHA